jgi:hypothetical protein
MPAILVVCLIIGVALSMPYFNRRFETEHPFAEWLFLGTMVPTAKAFVWPYFAFEWGVI